MPNPRRLSENASSQNSAFSSLSSILPLLKRPHVFPFILVILVLLTWVFLRIQPSPHFSSVGSPDHRRWGSESDFKANLAKFTSSRLAKDKRGWLLNPVAAAHEATISGGAVSCVSVHVGEIRPGGVRGNHRHLACNETFIIWGARTKFRVENSQVEEGYAEVTISEDEVAVAVSPSGTAHALVNIDPVRITFFLGCQDCNNASTTVYKVWDGI